MADDAISYFTEKDRQEQKGNLYVRVVVLSQCRGFVQNRGQAELQV
jgi:hypothetical protein